MYTLKYPKRTASIQTEWEILDLLMREDKPMKFHEVQKKLGYSSGKLQNAIKRLVNKGLIFKKKVALERDEYGFSSGRKDVTMIFYKDFPVDVLVPIKMNENTAKIISKVVDFLPQFNTLEDLMKEALIDYFRKLPSEIKIKAIDKAVKEGYLTKEKGDEILGR